MELLRRFMKEEDGLGTVEIVLISVILIGLVALFKPAITEVFNSIMEQMTKDVDSIIK